LRLFADLSLASCILQFPIDRLSAIASFHFTNKKRTDSIMSEKITDSGLKFEDLNLGTGDTAVSGNRVSVHYTGWLLEGDKFDSSLDRNQPFDFTLGKGMVIAGWDEGVAGMRVGGKRRLTIPPQLGYGAQGAGGVIPPHATLVFDVELLSVEG
jgi:FKBP-type peptidyl-prolyl cis-trans isomerase FkpA